MRQVSVNRKAVLDAIIELNESCTTQEIANQLSTPDRLMPERSVRAAVTWLVLSQYLVKSVNFITRYEDCGRPYKVRLYTWTGKDLPIDTKRTGATRRNREEREVQQHWGQSGDVGLLLQELSLNMKGARP